VKDLLAITKSSIKICTHIAVESIVTWTD